MRTACALPASCRQNIFECCPSNAQKRVHVPVYEGAGAGLLSLKGRTGSAQMVRRRCTWRRRWGMWTHASSYSSMARGMTPKMMVGPSQTRHLCFCCRRWCQTLTLRRAGCRMGYASARGCESWTGSSGTRVDRGRCQRERSY